MITEEELARSGSPLMYGAYVALRRAALMARERRLGKRGLRSSSSKMANFDGYLVRN